MVYTQQENKVEEVYEKEDVMESLRNGICVVSFTKMNGDTRVMKCTLQSGYLPEQDETKAVDVREGYENVVNCWDIDASGWRSFRLDRITRINTFIPAPNGVYKQA